MSVHKLLESVRNRIQAEPKHGRTLHDRPVVLHAKSSTSSYHIPCISDAIQKENVVYFGGVGVRGR